MLDLSDGEGTPEVTGAEEGVTDAQVTTEEGEVPAPKPSFKDFESDPDFQRYIQSEADRRAAKALATERKRQADFTAQQRRRAELEEEARLEAEGEYEELGKRTAKQKAEQRVLSGAIDLVASTIEAEIRSLPEVASLGDEALYALTQDVLADGGDLITFIAKLLGEKETRTREAALAQAEKDFEAELDAKLKEYGVERRTEQNEAGELPGEALVAARGGTKPRTYKDASQAYIDGTLSIEEFEPYLKKHQAEHPYGS